MNRSEKKKPAARPSALRAVLFMLLAGAWGHPSVAQAVRPKSFLVCGDSKVLIVAYGPPRDSLPQIVWTWDAHLAPDLPEAFRTRKFNSTDDCKAVNRGRQILVSSSSGAIAVVNVRDKRVLFHADVPNAHSIEWLPGNRLAAAASTHARGNRIMVFDLDRPARPVFTDSLHSAHGLVWNRKRSRLFALGYGVLREYELLPTGSLSRAAEWSIPGIGGHDLQAAGADHLFMTEQQGAWLFSLRDHTFSKIGDFPDAANIKSLGRDRTGQYIFTVPEESWWTYHVKFLHPAGSVAFPGMKVYKARWMRP